MHFLDDIFHRFGENVVGNVERFGVSSSSRFEQALALAVIVKFSFFALRFRRLRRRINITGPVKLHYKVSLFEPHHRELPLLLVALVLLVLLGDLFELGQQFVGAGDVGHVVVLGQVDAGIHAGGKPCHEVEETHGTLQRSDPEVKL